MSKRGWSLAAVAMVTALSLSGCSSRGASLGTTSSPCFHALPAAAREVGPSSRFLGVRLISASRLVKRVPEASVLGRAEVCLVAYEGHYFAGELRHALDHRSGRFAVVAVTESGGRVLGSLVLTHLPLPFRHTF